MNDFCVVVDMVVMVDLGWFDDGWVGCDMRIGFDVDWFFDGGVFLFDVGVEFDLYFFLDLGIGYVYLCYFFF